MNTLKNYIISFCKQKSLNRPGLIFLNFAFSELTDVAKHRVHNNIAEIDAWDNYLWQGFSGFPFWVSVKLVILDTVTSGKK